MSMNIEEIYRVGYSAGLCGHKCYPLGNHIVNDAMEELEALREELAALRDAVSNYRESKTTLHMYEMFDLIEAGL